LRVPLLRNAVSVYLLLWCFGQQSLPTAGFYCWHHLLHLIVVGENTQQRRKNGVNAALLGSCLTEKNKIEAALILHFICFCSI